MSYSNDIVVTQQNFDLRKFTKYDFSCEGNIHIEKTRAFSAVRYCCQIESIIELLGHCKGGNFTIHIWTWFSYFICSIRDIRFYVFGKE